MKLCIRYTMLAALCAGLAACSSTAPPSNNGAPSGTTGTYKVGQPYQINGITYYPHEDYSYDETGVASWYGADFHEQRTANGEIYNMNELTAAHKTLPLPSLARVTNLDNGRSIVVRINDRGPFSGARIIDVSQRAAQLLGFEKTGTAKVRVQVLADESKAIADALRHYGPAGSSTAVAANDVPVNGGPAADVTAAPLTAVQTETLAPIATTPATHQQLVATKPVAQVVMVPLTGATHLYVQAGSFTVAENASKLQQRLAPLGTVSVNPIVINGTKFYRVRVGPLGNVGQADAVLAKVRQAGAAAARTVVDK